MTDAPQKKLWAVDIEGVMMVVAVDAQEASDVALRYVGDATEEELSTRPRPPNNYDLSPDVLASYPWGGDGDITVAQWIEKGGGDGVDQQSAKSDRATAHLR